LSPAPKYQSFSHPACAPEETSFEGIGRRSNRTTDEQDDPWSQLAQKL
jgi:hypothetical protein